MPGSQSANFLAATFGDELICASVEDTLIDGRGRVWVGTCDFLFESKMTVIGDTSPLGGWIVSNSSKELLLRS